MHRLGFGGLLGCGCHLRRAGRKERVGKKDAKSNLKIKIAFVVLSRRVLQRCARGFGEFGMQRSGGADKTYLHFIFAWTQEV